MFGGDGGIAKPAALAVDRGQGLRRIEIDDVDDDVIGVLHLDAVAGDR